MCSVSLQTSKDHITGLTTLTRHLSAAFARVTSSENGLFFLLHFPETYGHPLLHTVTSNGAFV